jgi:ACR3 family arsenite efflux pump ArsB
VLWVTERRVTNIGQPPHVLDKDHYAFPTHLVEILMLYKMLNDVRTEKLQQVVGQLGHSFTPKSRDTRGVQV